MKENFFQVIKMPKRRKEKLYSKEIQKDIFFKEIEFI